MLQRTLSGALVLILCASPIFAQRGAVTACKRPALAALKPRPEIEYPCGESDYDEKQLKSPERVAALKQLVSELSTWTTPAWWQTSVVDLNACDFRGKPGALTADERHQFAHGEYGFWLFGNNQIRLVLVPDPCYQTEYNGSNAFLLYRQGDKVFVSQVLDGYFSRADNSVSLDFGKLNNELIIEILTGSGGLNPTLTNYYFVIDPQTNVAMPRKLFAGEHGPTNEITSAMLFGDPPPATAPLNIIARGTFAKSFNVYTEDERGKIEDNGRMLSRKIKRWNGKLYR
jgi:hypothetical protein